jgi:hypothetical protein
VALIPLSFLIFFFENLAAPLASIIALVYLFNKRLWYWHWRNIAVVLGFFAFFLSMFLSPVSLRESAIFQTQIWTFAVQDTLALIVGFYGFYKWNLELRQNRNAIEFNQPRADALTWAILVTVFSLNLVFMYFKPSASNWTNIVTLAFLLIADFALIQQRSWAWMVLLFTNILGITGGIVVLSRYHIALSTQILLPYFFQLIKIGMDVFGWLTWRKLESRATPNTSAQVTLPQQNHPVLDAARSLLFAFATIGVMAGFLLLTGSTQFLIPLPLAAAGLCLGLGLLIPPRAVSWAIVSLVSSVVLLVVFVLILGTMNWSFM